MVKRHSPARKNGRRERIRRRVEHEVDYRTPDECGDLGRRGLSKPDADKFRRERKDNR